MPRGRGGCTLAGSRRRQRRAATPEDPIRVVHIEPKPRVVAADRELLARVLAGHVGRELTPADAAALSGLPLDAAEAALLALARRHPARIRVTERGELLVRVDVLAPHMEGTSPWDALVARVRRRVLEPLVAALTILVGPLLLAGLTRDIVALGSAAQGSGWFFVVVIPCMAIGAFAALGALLTALYFVALPLAGVGLVVGGGALLVVAATESGDAGGVAFAIVLGLLMLGLGVPLAIGGVHRWLDVVFRRPTWARGLWREAIVLLFGPARPAPRDLDPDGLADERRLVALIRELHGVVAIADLVALFGWTPAEADAAMARILCDYGGDVAATDEGAVVYTFTDRLAVSGAGVATGSVLTSTGVAVPLAPAPAPPPESFFGPERGGKVALLVALGFGALGVLVHPTLPLFPGPTELAPELPELATDKSRVFLPGLGLWPYTIIYGAIVLRAPSYLVRRARAARRRELERYLRVAGERPAGAPFEGADLGIVARLGGDYDGHVLSFPELARDRAAAERLRAAAATTDHAPSGATSYTT